MIEQIADEFSTEELREFLEANRNPVPADPIFKERLREKLWKMLEEFLPFIISIINVHFILLF